MYAAVIEYYFDCPSCQGSSDPRLKFFQDALELVKWVMDNFGEYEFQYAKNIQETIYVHGKTRCSHHNVQSIELEFYKASPEFYSVCVGNDPPLFTIHIGKCPHPDKIGFYNTKILFDGEWVDLCEVAPSLELALNSINEVKQ
jgi:hypothetical protein